MVYEAVCKHHTLCIPSLAVCIPSLTVWVSDSLQLSNSINFWTTTTIEKEEKRKKKRPRRELNIVMSGHFRTKGNYIKGQARLYMLRPNSSAKRSLRIRSNKRNLLNAHHHDMTIPTSPIQRAAIVSGARGTRGPKL